MEFHGSHSTVVQLTTVYVQVAMKFNTMRLKSWTKKFKQKKNCEIDMENN